MKLVLMNLAILFSTSAFAASPEVFKAALNVPEVVSMSSIEKVEVTATMRCPYCYELTISGKRSGFVEGTLQDAFVVVQTRGDFNTKTITAEFVQMSK